MKIWGWIISFTAGLSLAALWLVSVGTSRAVAVSEKIDAEIGADERAGYPPGVFVDINSYHETAARGATKQDEWVTETVDSESVGLKGTSLALDSMGNPHISYQAGGELTYAVRNGDWHLTTLTGLEGSFSALALLGNQPHMMFFTYFEHSSRMEYVYQDGAGDWLTGVVVPTGNNLSARESVTVIMDDEGILHVAFTLYRCYLWGPTDECWQWYPGDLMYSYREGSGWKEPVAAGYTAKNSSMALDAGKNVYVSSYNYKGWDDDHVEMLYHGYLGRGLTSPVISVVDTPGVVGDFNDIALDESVFPPMSHISYYDTTNGDLKYAKRTGATSWQIDVVDSAGNVGQCTSIALDSSGKPHISYYDETNQDLKYAYLDDSGWHTQTVDSAGNVGLFTSLALDANDQPHIAYIDVDNGDLIYAHLGSFTMRVYLPLLGRDWIAP